MVLNPVHQFTLRVSIDIGVAMLGVCVVIERTLVDFVGLVVSLVGDIGAIILDSSAHPSALATVSPALAPKTRWVM